MKYDAWFKKIIGQNKGQRGSSEEQIDFKIDISGQSDPKVDIKGGNPPAVDSGVYSSGSIKSPPKGTPKDSDDLKCSPLEEPEEPPFQELKNRTIEERIAQLS